MCQHWHCSAEVVTTLLRTMCRHSLVVVVCASCRYATLAEPVLADPILFGDFSNVLESDDSPDAPPRLYKDVGTYGAIQPIFEALLTAYNAKHKPMQLVFFDDALEHLTRIIRTLRLPMVGSPGSLQG